MACNVEANGTTVSCACSGCGISYNHVTKKYHILCCGVIFEMDAKLQAEPGIGPGPTKGFELHLAGVTLLEAAQLLDRSDPRQIKVTGSLSRLRKRVTMKAKNKPMSALIKKLKLTSA